MGQPPRKGATRRGEQRLRHHRLLRGWTLDGVADRLDQLAPTVGKKHLGVTGAMVGKWERGVQQPRGIYRELLCVLYETTADELGLCEPSGAEAILDAMQRRVFLQRLGEATGFAVGLAAVEPWARLTAALNQPSRVDRQTISELEHVTVSLEGLESQVSPRALLGPVVGHLNTVASLLRGTPRSSQERRLCSIAGETAGLAGWLTWDLEDRRAAGAYFHAGIQAAQEADDKALGAYLVGSSCVQPAYRERPYARLRRLEGRTHGFTRTDANPSTRAWLVTLEAEAHALAGDERSTLRALDEADTAMSRAGEEDTSRRPRVAFFNRTYLAGERGVALARLERPEAAREVLEGALSSLDPRPSRPARGYSPRLPPHTFGRATLTRRAGSAATRSDSPRGSRSGRTSKTYGGCALSLSRGAPAARSRSWTSSSPSSGRCHHSVPASRLHPSTWVATPRGNMEPRSGKVYQRTTVYLTAEQRQWLRRVAAQAQLNDVPMSASDVVRLAIVRLRDQLPDDKLREALIAHIQTEIEEYPGRARRGLPQEIRPQD